MKISWTFLEIENEKTFQMREKMKTIPFYSTIKIRIKIYYFLPLKEASAGFFPP